MKGKNMRAIIALIIPRLKTLRAKGRQVKSSSRFNPLLILGSMGLLFWGGIFAVSLRVLFYFKSIEALGDILAFKLLSMVLVTLFSLLIFSSILTNLSKLYLSRDLPLVHALPVPGYQIFIARFLESTVDSSWMVIVYTLPVFIAFGIAYQAGMLYYSGTLAAILLLALLASALSALLIMPAALVIPAGGMRTIIIFLGIIVFVVLFIAFRVLRPERLVEPEVFKTTLQYLAALKTPDAPFYPTTWAFDGLKAALSGRTAQSLFHFSLLLSGTCTLIFISILTAAYTYFQGLSRTEAAARRLRTAPAIKRFSWGMPGGTTKAFVLKELRTFMRDQTQWTQIFLIIGLIAVYIYNFSVLPLERAPIKAVYLQNLFSFLNMGLAAFVLTAITARFAFPAVSQEKDAIWVVYAAPVSRKTFLWIKYIVYLLPLLLLTEILIIATNLLLRVTPFMMVLSIATIFCITPGVVALGIGLGAAHPDYKAENPIQTVTSFGGFLFMLLAGIYIAGIILLEAGPVYRIFMAGIKGRPLTWLDWAWGIAAFSTAFLVSIAMVVVPMRHGVKCLDKSLGFKS